MAESLNTKCDVAVNGISYLGFNNYGKIMVGDNAFEFYNDRDSNDFVQIPWEEVDYIVADVVFKGKWIPRFAIETKRNGTFRFAASKNTKKVLKACTNYIPADHVVRARSAFENMRINLKRIFGKDKL